MPPPHLESGPQEEISAVMGRFHAWAAGLATIEPRAPVEEDLAPVKAAARPRLRNKPMTAEDASCVEAPSAPPSKPRSRPDTPPSTRASLRATTTRVAAGESPVKPSRKPARNGGTPEPEKSMTFRGALAACLAEAPRENAGAIASPTRPPSHRPAKKAAKKAPVISTGLDAKTTPRERQQRSTAKRVAGERVLSVASAGKLVKSDPGDSLSQTLALTISVHMRVSQEEHDRMCRGADEADLSLAAFILQSALRFQRSHPQGTQALMNARFTVPPHLLPVTVARTDDRPDEQTGERALRPASPSLLVRIKNFWLGRRFTAMA